MKDFQTEPGGLGDKFRLLYSVATDGRASRSHVAVMGVILWRFNKAHGCCWPSIASIAEDAGLDDRTAQRALDALESWDYLHTLRQRGKLNRYIPHFQAQRQPLSNGTRAVGDPRHPRPGVTASPSKSNGAHAVPPPARTPPEYLNESIPESKKEKSSFDFSGNRETGTAGQTPPQSEAEWNPHGFEIGSPEKRVAVRIMLARAARDLSLTKRGKPESIHSARNEYLTSVEVPDKRALAMLDAAEREFLEVP